ncbi:hypothetical protein A2456_02955 [Candidatus Nomurabacteria bacterium RIFOXYC2_FULL_36_19]|uniref:Uncharacterized protein n=3 Tax=Candidatus Nomuraibacteriota TaxID=1752729 RepID=A0A1F6YWN2_9BACT|nr:MAG: Peptidase [Candidatus Nomurabacteria bacterium GW2011_GWC2_35_8]OGJ04732.1 MAG: hypothetical protein A2238_01040 [Candidatus Nomurabacteria bacterium RIFOXYA2_FULL_35_9]OGJ06616.1 MAG: hypothetical protein A2192_00765 [Candidatus Nomurabacteria bacterium RIFOXYA1_FULL_35_17]OGJ10766.1 MAG: hypothetical protein A2456_02955 [Candidatus Nomurabacteria bacterium RIFOXYC2_FULL_36_19]OGJ13959.1 MAG: hypothetical protein A2554_03000 [Candidatus Nomurabacteria bacterium RIFOXYD2_FULL_35_12]
MTRNAVIAFIFIISLFFSLSGHKTYAVFDCLTLTVSSAQSDKDYCQNELSQIEAQLSALLEQQKEQQKTSGTLKGDVDYLTSKINTLKAKIKARALTIAQLKVNITEKVNTIKSLSDKIEREHESLAQLLRNTNEFDDGNLVSLILSNKSVSDFYSDLESYTSIKQAVKSSIDIVNGAKTQTEVAKKDLENKQSAELDAKAELESAQKTVAKSEAEKKQLLSISKNKEAEYQKLADAKKVQANKIRSALFSLAGISQKIDFGTALQYANEVKSKLGVDPAFLLAILTQESSLGANVGQCYLTNPDTGAGVGKNTGKVFANVMNPTRDVPVFLSMTVELGFNAYKTAVSCPVANIKGYGGAMGPAQFIPSTWKIFASRLKDVLGSVANPWAPRDAFMASGMFLSDLGAVGTSTSKQNKAACSYYGTGLNQIYNTKTKKYETVKKGTGTSCSYSRSVQKLKLKIQADIDLL